MRSEQPPRNTSGSDAPVAHAVRARARRNSVLFILAMSLIFGAAMYIIYLEDRSGMQDDRRALERSMAYLPTGETMVAQSATGSPTLVTFDPNPFSRREQTEEVDPQAVSKAVAEVRVAYQYLLAKQLDWAEEHARRALEIWPDMNAAQRILGMIYIKRGQFDRATIALEAALRTDPFNAETYNSLATIYMNRSRMGKAEELLLSALNVRPRYSVAHYNLGLLYLVINRDELAIEHLEDALQQFGNEPGIFNNLGVAYMRLGDYENARAYYERAIEKWPQTPAPYFNAAISHVFEGDFNAAVEWLARGAEHATPLEFRNFMEDEDFIPLKSHPEAAAQIERIYNGMVSVPD